MPKKINTPSVNKRNVRFRIALLIDGRRKVSHWAAEHNVEPAHVYHVMEGHTTSDRIEFMMNEYTVFVFNKHKVSIGGDAATARA
jgi:hypothetical protein